MPLTLNMVYPKLSYTYIILYFTSEDDPLDLTIIDPAKKSGFLLEVNFFFFIVQVLYCIYVSGIIDDNKWNIQSLFICNVCVYAIQCL